MRTWLIILSCSLAGVGLGCGGNAGGDDPDAAIDEPDAGPPMLTCDAVDVDAPVVWQTSPIDRTIAEAPGVSLAFRVADGCGVAASSITLRVGGAMVTPVVTGDPRDLLVEFDPPADFALDAIVVAELDAADDAGNAMTSRLTFRIWDDYILGFRESAGLDSTAPTTPSGWRASYHVEAVTGGGQRMLGRMANPGGTLFPPGARFVTARLHACVAPISVERTIEAYRLNAAFEAPTTSWTRRSTATAWTTPGADAVPQDREAAAFATLVFMPVPGGWSQADSADITPLIQTWYDGGGDFDMLFIGAPGGVDVDNGNCPPWVLGLFGRPLPPPG